MFRKETRATATRARQQRVREGMRRNNGSARQAIPKRKGKRKTQCAYPAMRVNGNAARVPEKEKFVMLYYRTLTDDSDAQHIHVCYEKREMQSFCCLKAKRSGPKSKNKTHATKCKKAKRACARAKTKIQTKPSKARAGLSQREIDRENRIRDREENEWKKKEGRRETGSTDNETEKERMRE